MNQVSRGSSWFSAPEHARITNRSSLSLFSVRHFGRLGFRIAKRQSEPRGMRGGSWHGVTSYCQSAHRNHGGPDDSYGNLGFRIIRRKL